MKLIYQKDHISIKKFDPIEIANFTILTGLNGSGKTHLLQAIENQSVLIEGCENESRIFFDYRNFFLDNESAYLGYQIHSEKEGAWYYFEHEIKNTIVSYKNNLGDSYKKIIEIADNKNKNFWELRSEDVEIIKLYNILESYRENVKNLFEKNEHFKNNPQAKAIFILLKELKYSIDEISMEFFLDKYKPHQFKNDFLPVQLGKIMSDYFYKLDNNRYNRLRNKDGETNINFLSDEKFIDINGEKPWKIIREILYEFKNFDFEITDPESLNLTRDQNFQFKLINKNKNVEVNLENLSSGEKVLMALIAAVYKNSSDKHFPKILLLDEIDASLHPSMIQNLLDVIEKVFVKNGIRIIFATHSPTTIALSPEESIYLMNKDEEKRIEKKEKSAALSILTEGFATLEEGIKLFDQVSIKEVSIITEGYNAAYLKKACDFFGDNTKIEIISGVERGSGKNQLKTLFYFFSKVPHNRKVFFVWDCDCKRERDYSSLQSENNTYPFIFQKNTSNDVAKSGIENLFDVNLFDNFSTKVTDSQGTERKEFDGNRKKDFGSFVINRNSKDDFINFKPLFDKIGTVLNLNN